MLKKLFIALLFLSTTLFATLKNVEASPNAITGMKVIDIRTPEEWMQTGIVKDSHTIMFFDEKGGYDLDKFLSELNKVVKKDEPFALICRTGSRTTMISQFLSEKLGYNVVNLQGGILHLMAQGYKPAPYKK
ncbi:MAG: rhodanese-like domain-containing protein [Campylobacterales bacterium]|nr:rhodanese-like domain-containing protein [Campylobacterales bacterium]